jgi:hypothetical protein
MPFVAVEPGGLSVMDGLAATDGLAGMFAGDFAESAMKACPFL